MTNTHPLITPLPDSADSESLPTRPSEIPLSAKLQWLMFFRVLMITVLLGTTLIVNARTEGLGSDITQALLAIIITTYGLTIIYAVLLKQITWLKRFAQIQLLGDVLLTTALVHLTGGAESVFLFMFSLNVVNAAVLLYRPGALQLAAISAGVVLLLMLYRWWQSQGTPTGLTPTQARNLLQTGAVNVAALFAMAWLSGYLAEQLKDTGQRLQVADADVRHLKALNALIATSIQSGLVGYSAEDRRVFFVNPAAERILGRPEGALLHRAITDIFPRAINHEGQSESPTPEVMPRWEQHLRGGEEAQVLGCSLSPLVDPERGRQGYIVVFQDLTRLRKMEDTLAREARMAALGRMAAGMAHELRNPLASMSGSIQMLSERPALDPDDRRLMDILSREIERLEGLISDFLQYAGHRPLNRAEIPLPEFLAEVAQMFDHRRREAGEPLPGLLLDVGGVPALHADPDSIRQIVWNLLNNAAQAMTGAGQITLRTRREEDLACIDVIDEGRGMDEETLGRIFEPFFTTRSAGTGLGLALVHRLVERHGGQIEVKSVVDQGSSFTLKLPIEGGGELIAEDRA